MQRIKTILRQKWLWVCQNKPFWLHALFWSITILVVAVRPAETNGTLTDFPVRFWGMCLQLIGAYTVWIDMTKTAKDFGEAPSFRNTLVWLKGLFYTPPPVLQRVTVDFVGTFDIEGYAPTVTHTSALIEERVARLEQEILNVNAEISTVRRSLAIQKKELAAEIKQRAAELQQDISKTQGQLRDALVGNYAALRFGACWLVIGIVLSSIAVEITNFFHMHWQHPRFW